MKAYIKPSSDIPDFTFSNDPQSIESTLDIVARSVDLPGLNPASGGHLGYIPGGGIYASALGDYMADVSNRYAGVHFASPGAVQMEHSLIDWMLQMVGYPVTGGGNLTTGGSLANLIGIVTARDDHGIKPADFHRAVIYQTEQAHHSIDKAIRIAGLGDCQVRNISLDEHYRMDVSALKAAIETDLKKDLIPLMIVANAGSTDTGAIDPLNDIADVCEDLNIWMHVDAAYGGFFLLVDEVKDRLKGIERSNSVVIDPHKGLFLPYGLGVILVRDIKKLYASHYYDANYLQDAKKNTTTYSPADLSPELTKHFRGLRLWLPLRIHGLDPFKAALNEKIMLAKYFHEEVQKIEGFKVGPSPDLSVVTYRFDPGSGNSNELNEKIIDEVHSDGRVFLTSTMLNDQFTMRLAVLSFRTHLDTINLTLEILKEKSTNFLINNSLNK
jgi:glutamate/tyrosine decarboxylase-like PLP-dependent enzyme